MSRSTRRTLVSHKLRPFNTGDPAVDKDLNENLRDHTAQVFEKIRYFDKYTPDHELTNEEITAGVMPTSFQYAPGDPRRYGAVLDGATDDTTALTNWALVGGSLTFPSLTAKISAAIPLMSNTTISASKGATITSTNAQISFLTATSKSKILVDGLAFTQTGTPATAYTAHVNFVTCTDCRVTNCTSVGNCWAGFLLDGCTRCKVDHCYVSGSLGSIADRTDICIHDLSGTSSSYCELTNNWCFGGGANGIMIQDPYNNTAPHHNLVQANQIGTHTQYGINHYIPGIGNNNVSGQVATGGSVTTLIDTTQAWTVNQFAGLVLSVNIAGAYFYPIITSNTSNTLTFPAIGSAVVATDPYAICGDTFNRLLDNWIDGITGAEADHSGTGIYAVGAWGGGLEIDRNHVNNCCSATVDRSHAPAGIGIGGPNFVFPTAPVVTNNVITGMTQGDGILVVLNPGGATVSDNEVYIPGSNNGTGPGGGTLLGSCIRIEQAPLSVIADNKCQCLGGGNSLFVYATATAMRDIEITGGYYEASQGIAVRIDQTGGFVTSNLVMIGVRGKHTANAQSGFVFNSVNGGVVCGCYGTAGTQPALSMTASTQLRISGGVYNSSIPVITTSGTCTGSFIDESTYWGTAANGMGNGGTGCAVTWRANAVPAAGVWAVGDTTEQSVPVVGNPKRWRCTVAGNPGTWVSEGNL